MARDTCARIVSRRPGRCPRPKRERGSHWPLTAPLDMHSRRLSRSANVGSCGMRSPGSGPKGRTHEGAATHGPPLVLATLPRDSQLAALAPAGAVNRRTVPTPAPNVVAILRTRPAPGQSALAAVQALRTHANRAMRVPCTMRYKRRRTPIGRRGLATCVSAKHATTQRRTSLRG